MLPSFPMITALPPRPHAGEVEGDADLRATEEAGVHGGLADADAVARLQRRAVPRNQHHVRLPSDAGRSVALSQVGSYGCGDDDLQGAPVEASPEERG